MVLQFYLRMDPSPSDSRFLRCNVGLSGQLLSCFFPNCIIHYHPYVVWPGIAQTAEQVEKNQPDQLLGSKMCVRYLLTRLANTCPKPRKA